jgi:hypothetical protein
MMRHMGKTILAILATTLFSVFGTRGADDPVEIEPSDDTWLSTDTTGKTGGRGERNELQIYGKDDNTMNRALIKFDLKRIAPGFKSAILRITAFNASYTDTRTSFMRCHAVTNAWNQESATWDLRSGSLKWAHLGGDWDPKPVCGYAFTGPIGGGGDRDFYFDLTDIVRQWQAQPNKNEGVMIMLEKGCKAEIRIRSKENEAAAQRPKLRLFYQKEASKMAMIIPGDQIPPMEPPDPAAPSATLNSKTDGWKLGDAVDAKYSASGAKEPYMFMAAGALAPGLQLTPDGTLKGKLSKAGAFIVGVTCTASNGKRSTEWERWVVTDPNAAPKPPPPAAKDPKDVPKPPADDKKPDKDKPPKKDIQDE